VEFVSSVQEVLSCAFLNRKITFPYLRCIVNYSTHLSYLFTCDFSS